MPDVVFVLIFSFFFSTFFALSVSLFNRNGRAHFSEHLLFLLHSFLLLLLFCLQNATGQFNLSAWPSCSSAFFALSYLISSKFHLKPTTDLLATKRLLYLTLTLWEQKRTNWNGTKRNENEKKKKKKKQKLKLKEKALGFWVSFFKFKFERRNKKVANYWICNQLDYERRS